MAEIEKWLLTTIPGVILLGAVGSILAVGILRLASTAITSWFPRTRRWLRVRKNLELGPHGWVMGSLSVEGNLPVLLAYFTFRVMKFIAALFVSGLGVIAYIVLASSTEGQTPTLGSLAFLLFFYAGFYFAIQEVRIVRIVYDREVVPRIKSVRESLRAAASAQPTESERDG